MKPEDSSEDKLLKEKLEAIRACDKKKEIVEMQILRTLEMKQTTDTATRIVIDNSHIVHNSFIVDQETAQRIFDVIYTSLTTERERLICEAEKLIGPVSYEEEKENETAPI